MGLLAGLALAELGLRLALDERPYPLALEVVEVSSPPARATDGPVRLAVVGDSVAAGVGDTQGLGLHGRLERHLSVPVWATSFARPGAAIAFATAEATRLVTQDEADAVVVVLFGDDLIEHPVVMEDGQITGLDGPIPTGAARWLIERSYVANLVWFHAVVRRNESTPAGDAAWVMVSATAEVERVARSKGTPLLYVLVAQSGLSLCDDPRMQRGMCAAVREDLGLMAGALDLAQVHWLDLRELWNDERPHIPPDEMDGWERRHMAMPVHPDAAGYELLAVHTAPVLEAMLTR